MTTASKITVRTLTDSDLDPRVHGVVDAAVAAGKPISLKVQPYLYVAATKQYWPWKGMRWTVDLENLTDVEDFNQTLAAFFQAIPLGRLKALRQALEQFRAEAILASEPLPAEDLMRLARGEKGAK